MVLGYGGRESACLRERTLPVWYGAWRWGMLVGCVAGHNAGCGGRCGVEHGMGYSGEKKRFEMEKPLKFKLSFHFSYVIVKKKRGFK